MSRAKMVWLMMDDEDMARRLLENARRHVRLALEYSRANTLPERRKVIQREIEALRADREALISQYAAREGVANAE